mmetsp:Transcript_35503/g.69633  ORF Transcript_35503/g.69633 Transcript_35503/m.69633 type:complete len:326 (+) Transcript_35503:10-987(+)
MPPIVKTKNLVLKKPPATIQTIENYFTSNDIITTDQEGLLKALTAVGFPVPMATRFASDFFVVGDPDKYGWIDTEDFIQEYQRMQIFKSVRAIISNLANYDLDHDGQISKSELMVVFVEQMGPEYAARSLYRVFDSVDRDGNGLLSEEELQEWYQKEELKVREKRAKAQNHKNSSKPQALPKKVEVKIDHDVFRDLEPGTELPQEKLEEIWEKYDKDMSGELVTKELFNVVNDLFDALLIIAPLIMEPMLSAYKLPENVIASKIESMRTKFASVDRKEIAQLFMSALDKDNDGTVSKSEFMAQFNAALSSSYKLYGQGSVQGFVS